MAKSEDEWLEDEQVLALALYLAHRNERLSKGNPEVIALSETLRRLARRDGRSVSEKFRNPAGMEMQLSKFLDLDDPTQHRGLGKPSKWHQQIWARYIDDRDALDRRAAEITGTLESGAPSTLAPNSVAREARIRPSRKVSGDELLGAFVPRPEIVERKSEARWVDPLAYDRANGAHESTRIALAQHLEANGFSVHEGTKPELLYDLGARRDPLTVIVEVKSLPAIGEETQLRLGLGQILWYRDRWREATDDPCVAVLCVERRPARGEQWQALCDSVAVVLTWPERFDVLVAACTRISGERRTTYRR
ncbi:hypothetical protein [Paraliomyxa miuraensis]|uniref:hypothetical protein n=1 Tax=Paraliomyxa miuraensis TaxID=376150 RepID=UPI00224EF71D|nr:hypothetical protein [Paraliomyxa miuraensis]MCX4243482.1 hypothetical protein [Paraliomyxa miuraensis]